MGVLRGRSAKSVTAQLLDNEDTLVGLNEPNSEMEFFAKEVLSTLIKDNVPPTPNNYSLYFDRLLESKDEEFKKQIHSILELEEGNDAENTIILEQSLKQGFSTIKNMLNVSATIYKNISLMTKILEKRKKELLSHPDIKGTTTIASALENDINKLNTILKKQNNSMKELYEETANVVKKVENETIFDNKYGIYNKRYLLAKIAKEIELIKEFGHESSLIMIELSKEIKQNVKNEKIIFLMTRTIARLLLKTSRRSDTVAHYGDGVFAILLKHTSVQNAQKAADRLCDLVLNSNFFLADKEIQLKIATGITKIDVNYSVEEIIVYAMEGIELSYKNDTNCYVVSPPELNENEE
jgi:diguanylate cyclase (GGDEF)-like protein